MYEVMKVKKYVCFPKTIHLWYWSALNRPPTPIVFAIICSLGGRVKFKSPIQKFWIPHPHFPKKKKSAVVELEGGITEYSLYESGCIFPVRISDTDFRDVFLERILVQVLVRVSSTHFGTSFLIGFGTGLSYSPLCIKRTPSLVFSKKENPISKTKKNMGLKHFQNSYFKKLAVWPGRFGNK